MELFIKQKFEVIIYEKNSLNDPNYAVFKKFGLERQEQIEILKENDEYYLIKKM